MTDKVENLDDDITEVFDSSSVEPYSVTIRINAETNSRACALFNSIRVDKEPGNTVKREFLVTDAVLEVIQFSLMDNGEKENLPAPAPMPSRATYGFASYLASFVAFGIYLIWAVFGNYFLDYLGFTFYPQKYWAVAIPIHFCTTLLAVGLIFYPAINLTMVPTTRSISLITDEYADYTKYVEHPDAIPRMTDIPINEVCEVLFLNNE